MGKNYKQQKTHHVYQKIKYDGGMNEIIMGNDKELYLDWCESGVRHGNKRKAMAELKWKKAKSKGAKEKAEFYRELAQDY